MNVTVRTREHFTPKVYFAECGECGWIGPGHLLDHAAEDDGRDHVCPEIPREHPVMDAIAHAQVAQSKRLGYRDAATRYDPSDMKGDT
jgi:hypothetical protein